MRLQKVAIAALGAVTLTAATLTLTLNTSAQEPSQGPPPPGQGPGAGPRGGQGFGERPGLPPGQPGQLRPGAGMMGGGGGGTAMDSDNSFLYIVQGNMLFKVAKADLRILGSVPLMQPRGDGPPEGGRIRRQGGDGGPPPPETAD